MVVLVQQHPADCRICLSAEPADDLVRLGCSCSGSLGFTHTSCIATWVAASHGQLKCELCGQAYNAALRHALAPLAAAAAASRRKQLADQEAALAVEDEAERQRQLRWDKLRVVAIW